MKRLLTTAAVVALFAPGAALACDKHESHSAQATPAQIEGLQSKAPSQVADAGDATRILAPTRDETKTARAEADAVN